MGYWPQKRGLIEVLLTMSRKAVLPAWRYHRTEYQDKQAQRTLASMWRVLVRRTSNSTGDPRAARQYSRSLIALVLSRGWIAQRSGGMKHTRTGGDCFGAKGREATRQRLDIPRRLSSDRILLQRQRPVFRRDAGVMESERQLVTWLVSNDFLPRERWLRCGCQRLGY
jgi:hypothetical protein